MLGILQNLIINRRMSMQWGDEDRGKPVLLDGHRRILVSLKHGQASWPVTYVDLTPAEEIEALLTLDPLVALAQAETEKLAALLHEVSSGESAVQQLLAQLAEREGIIPPDIPEDHWQGMPEFEQEDKLGIQQIIMHFDTYEDVVAFAALLEQPITAQTKSLWYPPRQRGNAAVMVADDPLT